MTGSLEQLEARRDELLGRLESIRADLARGLDKDSEEQALQLENFEVLQEIYRVTESELKTVVEQLSKLG